MQELYSIGETASIMGISVQTLRNYSNLELIKPQYIDKVTGYRYYSFKQFHIIDRIKYLRKLGIPLAEIEKAIKGNEINKLVQNLVIQKKRIEEELKNIMEMYEDVQWYIDYFRYMDNYTFDNLPYIRNLKARYIIFTKYLEDDTVESVETRLAVLKNDKQTKDFTYLRQYGFIADFHELMDKKVTKQKYFTYLKGKADRDYDFVMEIPAGEYLCFRAPICTDNWDPCLIKKYFNGRKVAPYVICNEYEDNLVEYHDCPYEMQMLIKTH